MSHQTSSEWLQDDEYFKKLLDEIIEKYAVSLAEEEDRKNVQLP